MEMNKYWDRLTFLPNQHINNKFSKYVFVYACFGDLWKIKKKLAFYCIYI